jgi:hypothetical protein
LDTSAVSSLRPRRRTGAILERSGDEDHSIARHRKLALAALAPQFEYRLAVIANLQRRQPLRSGLTRHIQRHLQPERKAAVSARRRSRNQDRCQYSSPQGSPRVEHLASLKIFRVSRGSAPF